jgi:hypothetical protein
VKDLIASRLQMEDIEGLGVGRTGMLRRIKNFNEISRSFTVEISEIYQRHMGSNK